jgi:hypothetical protein
MVYHILNGEALAETFAQSGIHGQVIICREALVDGPVSFINDEAFWKGRANFIQERFDADQNEYERNVRQEFDRISKLTSDDDIFLWFEHDLFCQANMWFIVSLLKRSGLTHAYRISPLSKLNTKWQGFGNHGPEDLKLCLSNRVEFSPGDLSLGEELWRAYSQNDGARLMMLSGTLSPCFPRLDEVCKAEIDRKKGGRPRKVLQEILSKGYSDFHDIFSQFSQREGIYGFGDSQVKLMLREMGK